MSKLYSKKNQTGQPEQQEDDPASDFRNQAGQPQQQDDSAYDFRNQMGQPEQQEDDSASDIRNQAGQPEQPKNDSASNFRNQTGQPEQQEDDSDFRNQTGQPEQQEDNSASDSGSSSKKWQLQIPKKISKFFKCESGECENCIKLNTTIEDLQVDIKHKNSALQSLSVKLNADFGLRQGTSLEHADVKRLWNDLFLYKATEHSRKQKSVTHSQSVSILCDTFIEIDAYVQEQLIMRISSYMTTLFSEQSNHECSSINLKDFQHAFSILLWCVDLPKNKKDFKLSEIDANARTELIKRMTDCLRDLFTLKRTRLEDDNSSANLKEVERAFSILVNNPSVVEGIRLTDELKLKIKDIIKSQSPCQETIVNDSEFFKAALTLCVRMRTRVPPYIIFNSEKHYVSALHDLDFVPGDPDLRCHPKMPVRYLRPAVYHNYHGDVFLKGLVIGMDSCTPGLYLEDSTAQSAIITVSPELQHKTDVTEDSGSQQNSADKVCGLEVRSSQTGQSSHKDTQEDNATKLVCEAVKNEAISFSEESQAYKYID